jgi:hypothetical protein
VLGDLVERVVPDGEGKSTAYLIAVKEDGMTAAEAALWFVALNMAADEAIVDEREEEAVFYWDWQMDMIEDEAPLADER